MYDTTLNEMLTIAQEIASDSSVKKGLLIAELLWNDAQFFSDSEWNSMSNDEKVGIVQQAFEGSGDPDNDDILEPIESSTNIEAATLKDLKFAVESRIEDLEDQTPYL